MWKPFIQFSSDFPQLDELRITTGSSLMCGAALSSRTLRHSRRSRKAPRCDAAHPNKCNNRDSSLRKLQILSSMARRGSRRAGSYYRHSKLVTRLRLPGCRLILTNPPSLTDSERHISICYNHHARSGSPLCSQLSLGQYSPAGCLRLSWFCETVLRLL